MPVLALQLEPQHVALELCAAPGSKSLQALDLVSSSEGLAGGLWIANVVNRARMMTLQARSHRQPRQPLMMMAEDAANFPSLLGYGAKLNGARKVRFDRVLCDVPCSGLLYFGLIAALTGRCPGDGTMRKSLSTMRAWGVREGISLHQLQLKILRRGLQLLAPGGRLVYSTCSLNPIENEAVVAAAVEEFEGSVRTVPHGALSCA